MGKNIKKDVHNGVTLLHSRIEHGIVIQLYIKEREVEKIY